MTRTLVVALAVVFCLPAMADPTEVILSTKLLAIKDAKTMQAYVLKGNKARIYSKVTLHAKGYSNRGLRNWLETRLPKSIPGFFEREDKDTGLSVRYRPVSFQLRRTNIFCTAASSPEYEVCHADDSVSSANAVDLPAGDGGEHAVNLQILPPEGDLRVKIARATAKSYYVLSGDPKLSKYSFAGMSDH